jgi:hypothetical protein
MHVHGPVHPLLHVSHLHRALACISHLFLCHTRFFFLPLSTGLFLPYSHLVFFLCCVCHLGPDFLHSSSALRAVHPHRRRADTDWAHLDLQYVGSSQQCEPQPQRPLAPVQRVRALHRKLARGECDSAQAHGQPAMSSRPVSARCCRLPFTTESRTRTFPLPPPPYCEQTRRPFPMESCLVRTSAHRCPSCYCGDWRCQLASPPATAPGAPCGLSYRL